LLPTGRETSAGDGIQLQSIKRLTEPRRQAGFLFADLSSIFWQQENGLTKRKRIALVVFRGKYSETARIEAYFPLFFFTFISML